MAHSDAANFFANLGGIDVYDARDRKTARRKPAVVRKCIAQVACANNDNFPFVMQSKFAFDLVHQVGNVVTNAPSAIASEVRQIFSHLGRINAGKCSQLVAGQLRNTACNFATQDMQVHGKPSNCGVGNALSR